MKKYKTIIITNISVFIALGLLMSIFGMAGVGAVGVILGAVNLLIALIVLAFTTKRYLFQGYLLCSAVLFLIGFSLCSAFPLSFH
jgi:hypothetical protein